LGCGCDGHEVPPMGQGIPCVTRHVLIDRRRVARLLGMGRLYASGSPATIKQSIGWRTGSPAATLMRVYHQAQHRDVAGRTRHANQSQSPTRPQWRDPLSTFQQARPPLRASRFARWRRSLDSACARLRPPSGAGKRQAAPRDQTSPLKGHRRSSRNPTLRILRPSPVP
jgi:hypothetical protein